MFLFFLLDTCMGGHKQPAVRLDYEGARPRPQSDHLPPRYEGIQLHDPTGRQPPRPIQPFSAPQPPRYKDPAGQQPLPPYQPLSAPQPPYY